jgi:hypothetical protein
LPLRREPATELGSDLELLAGTLGEWVAAGGSLLAVADVDAAVGAERAGAPLPSEVLGDLLVLSRAPQVRAAVVSGEGLSALQRVVPFETIVRIGLDGREVDGRGLALSTQDTPAAGWDRGHAVLWVLGQLASGLGRPIKTLYLGGAAVDEPAFATLAGRAATVRVGSPGPSRANFRLDTIVQGRRLLGALARAALARPPAPTR